LTSSSGRLFIKGVMSLGTGSLLAVLFGFLNLTIAARVIPKEDLGVCFLIFAIVGLVEVIGSLGLRPSAAKFVAGASSDRERQVIINNLLTFKLLIILSLSLLAIVSKPVVLHFFPSKMLSLLFIYVPVLFCIQSADLMLESIMQGFQLYKKMASIRVLASALNFLMVLLFLLVMRLGVEGFILATIFSLSFAALLRYWMIPVQKSLAFDRNTLRRLIKFGLPLQGNDILTFVSQRLDILILGAMVTPAAVAYLGIARRIPEVLLRLSNSLYSVYFPFTSDLFGRGQQAQVEEILNRVLRLTSFVTMFGALVVVLFQREIIVLVFSEKYLPSAPALGILMIIFTLSVASTILDYTLIAAGHPGYLPIISLADTVPSVVANLLLIPPFGFMGAVFAKLIANVTTNPVSVWGLRREKIGVKVGGYLKPLLFLMICLGIYLGLGRHTIALKAVMMMLFVVLCMSFSVVTSRDVVDLFKNLNLLTRQPILNK